MQLTPRQFHAASLFLCQVAKAFSFEFSNVISCLLPDLPWARELGDPQNMQLFLDDLAPGSQRRLIQTIGPSVEEGNIPMSVFSHSGNYRIDCEDDNGISIWNATITLLDCPTKTSTTAKGSASDPTTSASDSSSSIPSSTTVSGSNPGSSSSTAFNTTSTFTSKGVVPSLHAPILPTSFSKFPPLNISHPWTSHLSTHLSASTPSSERTSMLPSSSNHAASTNTSPLRVDGPVKSSPVGSSSFTMSGSWPHSNSLISSTPVPSITITHVTAVSVSLPSFSGSDFETLIGGLSPSTDLASSTTTSEIILKSQDPSHTITHAALATVAETSIGSIGSDTEATSSTWIFLTTSGITFSPTPIVHPTPHSIPLPTSGDSSDSNGHNQSIQQTMSQPGAIAGVTIGAVILAIALSLLIALCLLKHRRKRRFFDRDARKSLNPFFKYQAVSPPGSLRHFRDRSMTDMLPHLESAPVSQTMEADRQSRRGWNLKAQLRKWRSSNAVIEPFIASRYRLHPDMVESGSRRMNEARRFSDEDIQNDFTRMQEERLLLRSSSVMSVATTMTAQMRSAMLQPSSSDVEYQINRLHGPLSHRHHDRTQSPSGNSSYYHQVSQSNGRHGNASTKTGSSSNTSSKANYQATLPKATSSTHPRSPLPSYNSFNSPLALASSSEPPQLKRMSFQSTWANDPFLSNEEIERLAADEQEADWAMDGFLEPVAHYDLPPAYAT
ncbi:hypothetical protein F5876DRAFT_72803 [Lentinula aff. lateritia]|uniref:Uncharacterized protein n=1 Tax=Lentinula aff. lateritia TaxID=2804960 RepID=A0ACC1UCJ9_9AGAR|nr:hypothetical protein F5876DRAFT_72803 [Lentinula aff. lateritia]